MGISTNVGPEMTLSQLLTNHPIKAGEVQPWCAANEDASSFCLGSVSSNEPSGCLLSVTSGWYSGTDYSGTTFNVTNLGGDTTYNLSFLTASNGSTDSLTLKSMD